MLQVTVDQQSGFCFGVVYAIEMAEDYLEDHELLYCLGDIVHNDREVARLGAKGLKSITHDDLENLRDVDVLIRAHGEPPSTYQTALKNNIRLIDASCPVVLKLQNRVRNAFEEDAQIVILGKPGHAEVNGLVGQTGGNAIVVTYEEDLDKLDYSRPIQFFSQTTKSTAKFYQFKAEIERRQQEAQQQFKANDTICRQVSNREPQLKQFAPQYDAVVFVAGKKSSNGRVLHDVCKSVNPNTHFVSDPAELDSNWFVGCKTVGVAGATSTPMWLMEDVAEAIRQLPVPEAATV